MLGSTINPFATGIASGFAGTSASATGLIGRIVILVVGTAIGIWWVMRYAANESNRDPSRRCSAPTASATHRGSFKADADRRRRPTADADRRAQQAGRWALFFLAFVVMIIGVVPWSDLGITRIPTKYWWFPEMTASFLLFSILIGFAGADGGGPSSPAPSSTARATCWASR